MQYDMTQIGKSFSICATEFFFSMSSSMHSEITEIRKSFSTFLTEIRFFSFLSHWSNNCAYLL